MTDLANKKRLNMSDLAFAKSTLKSQIDIKQDKIVYTAKNLNPFSKQFQIASSNPLSLIRTPRRKGKTISILNGVVNGVNFVKNIGDIFSRRRHKKNL